MASALRKLLRSHSLSAKKADKGEKAGPQPGEMARPSYQHSARRLFSRVCRSMHHAAKVSPASSSGAGAGASSSSSAGAATGEMMLDVVEPDEEKPAAVLHLLNSKTLTSNAKEGVANNNNNNNKKKSNSNPMSETCVNHSRLVRTRRLMREYQDLCRRQMDAKNFSVELVNDNLYEWNVKLLKVDSDSELYRDMRETGTSCIALNLTFPDNFPFAPPFMRVTSPKIEKGFVMEGGAICMELLTPGGWASAYTIEAIIMQFSASLIKGQGRIVRKTKSGKDFNRKAAEASFRSLVKTHEKYGWVTPPLADG